MRENMIVLVGLSEGTVGGRRGKENIKEWKILETLHLCKKIIKCNAMQAVE
jgi:hypothetical protein